MIYPYCHAYEAYVRHSELLSDFEIVSLISPKGWGLQNETIWNGVRDLIVQSDFESGLKDCTVVWFVEDELHKLILD